MRIAVVGLGGVGGYIGASLAKTSNELVCFARGEHLKEIKKNGLTIVEDEITWSQKLNVKDLDDVEGYFDIVLFCVKGYDLEESLKRISKSIDSKTVLISFSNGVSNSELLRDLSDSVVLDGCVYILSHIEKYGVVRKKGKVFAAIFGGEKDATNILNTIFSEADLRTKIPSDIKTAIWKKYIFISFATLTSYYDKSIGYIYKFHKDEAQKILTEIALVASRIGVDINSEIEKSLNTACNIPYDSSTSMHLDFQNKKRDELKTISGYIVKKADELKVEVPLMQMMYRELLKKHKE